MNKPIYLKWWRLGLYLVVALFLAMAVSVWLRAVPAPEPEREGDRDEGREDAAAVVDSYLAALPLEARVGQLVMVGFEGRQPPPHLLHEVRAGRAGGIILFQRNLTAPEDVARLSRALQTAAVESSAAVPLLIAVDEEGGRVSRIPGILPLPGNMALGAGGDAAGVRAVAAALGRQLRHLGVTMNMAPVVDVNNNPANPVIGVRSFGEDPELVGRLGAAVVEGLQQAGVAAVAKHFPGHGDTTQDSHLDLPVIPHDPSRIRAVELPPFAAAAAAGVGAMMTAHIQFPQLEARGLPATLSPAIVGDLLRDELEYEGVVMTDALEMQAIARTYPPGVAAELALAAGVDIVLFGSGEGLVGGVVRHLVEAVAAGRLPAARVDEAARRVLILKYQLGLLASQPGTSQQLVRLVPHHDGEPWPDNLGASRQLVWEVTLGGLTRLGDPQLQLPPPHAGPVAVLAHESQRVPEGGIDAWLPHGGPATDWAAGGSVPPRGQTLLGHFLAARGYDVREVTFDWSPAAGQRAQLKFAAAGVEAVIVLTKGAYHYREQAALIDELLADGQTVYQVALEGPYDRAANPAVPVFLASYHHGPLNSAAAAAVLTGEVKAGGTLPVTLPH